ncbi:MAG: hypothetical protein ABIZ69_01140 [Ilumatobacteraceae bacterium]
MTDSAQPQTEGSTAAERLAALRAPSTQKRGNSAHASKILAAGLSTTAMFGMVAALGWQSGTTTAQGAGSAAVPTSPSATAPATVPSAVSPGVTTTTGAAVATPAWIPVVIPVAVPAAKTAPSNTTPGRTPSNVTTKSSG